MKYLQYGGCWPLDDAALVKIDYNSGIIETMLERVLQYTDWPFLFYQQGLLVPDFHIDSKYSFGKLQLQHLTTKWLHGYINEHHKYFIDQCQRQCRCSQLMKILKRRSVSDLASFTQFLRYYREDIAAMILEKDGGNVTTFLHCSLCASVDVYNRASALVYAIVNHYHASKLSFGVSYLR